MAARLRAIAKEKNRDPADLWQSLILERFLARLAKSEYSKNFILKDVRRGIDNLGNMIRIPVNLSEEIRRMKYTERVLSQKLGREPKLNELADALEMHEKHITKLRSLLIREPISLDAYNQEKFQEDSDE